MHTQIHRTIAYLLSFSLMLSLLPLPGVRAAETDAALEPALSAATQPEETLAATEPMTLPKETLPPEVSVSTEPVPPDPTTSETPPSEPEIPTGTELPEEIEPDAAETLFPTDPVEYTESTGPTVPTETTESTEPVEEEQFYSQEIPDDFIVPISSGTGRSTFSALHRSLPASYDSREAGRITPIRDQRPWQLCWAFSALAVGESQLVSSNQTDRSVDLSEEHLGFYFHGDAYDPLGNASGDGTYLAEDYRISGNNNKFTTFALANWVGGAAENDYPYGKDPNPQNRAAAMDNIVHLTNAFWINARDTNTIKNYIIRNGSVGLSIYYKESFLNKETAAYCNDQYTATNHAITVVGWDDHFPAEYFVTAPECDGAWLCKNSLGTEFGQNGYFWLSYQDKAISHHSATAFVFEFESSNNYTWNYHHDGSFGTSVEFVASGGAIANVYTASGSADGSDEQLQAIGLALADTDVHYSIQIYRDPVNPTDPTSGEPALTVPQTGVTSLCGFYTIQLLEPVTLRRGETFSIVITLTNTGGGTIRYFADRSYINGSWIQFVSHTEPGESYAALTPGSWIDLADRQSTARIKAYTVELDSRSVNRLFFEPDSILLAPGEHHLQLPTREPSNADPCVLVWQSENEDVASVAQDGTVTAISHGESIITAATPDGRISASYKVMVKPELDAIHILQAKTEMIVGECFTPEAMVYPVSAAPHYPLTLYSSDEEVASVSDGTVTAIAPGTAVITFRSDPYYAQYTLTITHSIESAQAEVSSAVYRGVATVPLVSVTMDGVSLTENTDYTLRFDNNTAPGTGTVTITGIGIYSGIIRQDFSITLPALQLHRAENEAKGIRLSWENAEGLSGYYLYRQKNGGSWKHIKTISGTDVNTYLDTSASSSGVTYYYRMVPYVKIRKTTYRGPETNVQSLCRLPVPTVQKIRTSDAGILLQWKKVPGADAYQIFRATDDGVPELLAHVTGEKALSFTDSSPLETGVIYTYSVQAEKNQYGQRFLSACSESRSACYPAQPAALTAVNEGKGLRLSWDPVPLATGYEIYRSTNGIKWTKVKTISGVDSTDWIDTSRISGTRYFYRVKTLSKLDGITFQSAVSDTVSCIRLAAPQIQKISASETGFVITWKKVSGADAYQILRSKNNEPAQVLAVMESGKVLQFQDATATETGVRYTYSLVALNNSNETLVTSVPSSVKSACKPDAPVLLPLQNCEKGILLEWNRVSLATGYEIYRSTNGIKWSKVKTISGVGTTSWTDTSRSSGSRAFYRILSYSNIDGITYRSIPSAQQWIHRLAAPSIRKITAVQNGFSISWKRVSGADSYLLLRSDDGSAPRIVGRADTTLGLTDVTATDTSVLYTYQVVAQKTAGEHTDLSAGSSEKSACKLDAPMLYASEKLPQGILLDWDSVKLATGYEIYRSTNGIKWTKVKTVSSEITNWTDTSRISKASCRYRITAIAQLDGTVYLSPASAPVQLSSYG